MECSAATCNQNKFILIKYTSGYKNNVSHPISGFQEYTGFILRLPTTHNKIKWDFFSFSCFFMAKAQICDLHKKNTAWSVPWQKFHIIIRFNFKIPLCFKIHVISIRIWSTVTFNLLRKYTFIPHREEGVGNTVSNSPEHFEF